MARKNTATTTTTHTNKETTVMATALDNDVIAGLLAGSKQRGVYKEELDAFLARGNRGEQIDLANGTLAGKKPQSVKTGFENARKNLAEEVKPNIQVILNEENVYLINKSVEA